MSGEESAAVCCFLATLMGAGGHQVAKTETATFKQRLHHGREPEHLHCILLLFHEPLMIMVLKIVFHFL